MPTVRGGAIRQFTVDGREYSPAADAEVTYRVGKGGRRTNESTLTGNGELVTNQSTQPVGIDSITIVVNSEKGDVEALQDIENTGNAVAVSMTLASNHTYQGALVIQGDLNPSSNGQLEISALGQNFEQV